MGQMAAAPPQRLTPRRFAWLAVGALPLLTLCLCCSVPEVGSACPSDVTMAAHACFTEFSREYQNVKHSPKLLCCGVDVETLRAFCSSYMRAANCIEELMVQCEDPTAIGHALTNLQGARPALHALCFDDTLIERYARHQSCIAQAGPTTLQCLRRYLNTSSNVRLLANVHLLHTDHFCRSMSQAMQCVGHTVGQQCGYRVAQLVAILILPMIRYSTSCDLSPPEPSASPVLDQPVTEQKEPTPSSQSESSPGSQHGSRPGSPPVFTSAPSSASSHIGSAALVTSWTTVLWILATLQMHL